MKAHFLSAEVRRAVDAYLLARAHAETMRQQVDAIAREILDEMPIYAKKRRGSRRIYEGADLYLAEDKEACSRFYAEANRRERAAKLKPAEMQDEHCPALVAEHLQLEAERLLIDVSGEPFGVTHKQVWRSAEGLRIKKEWTDCVVGFVVNQPGYISPLEKPCIL